MKIRHKLYIAMLLAFSNLATAQDAASIPAQSADMPLGLKEIAQKAVLNNPEIQTRWHAFRAAINERRAAWGGFLPRVDASFGVGHDNLRQSNINKSDTDYPRWSRMLSLNQMVFDGFATSNEVKRLDKAELVRYYELLDTSESIALEASRAYYDVMRYRQLVALAEDNYVQHKAVYEQLVRRTQSGVGRRADMEQAGSRLALAESNLTTELANLHDVTARYQRIVGEQPPATLTALPQLNGKLPARTDAALEQAFQRNPALLASVENLQAALYEIEVRRAAYLPRVDIRARTDNTTNYLGEESADRHHKVVEVVMNYNLYNGGSDMARHSQYIERKNAAQDLRDKACRDIRQTLSIAYNDTGKLKDQLTFAQTQVGLLEKTRNAYRDQFNVGQRTLLDLLDTENELFNARRAAVNADVDLSLSYMRVYAGMGELLEFLGLKRVDAESGITPDAERHTQVDSAEICPAEAPAVVAFDREALDARAAALVAESARGGMLRGAMPVTAGGTEGAVMQVVQGWAAAWTRKDYNAYAAFYAPTFIPDGGLTREDWAQLRKGRLNKAGSIDVELQNLKVRMDGERRALVEFRQVYNSESYRDVTDKVLELTKTNGKWLIQRESSLPTGRKK